MDSEGAKFARTQQSVRAPWARESPGAANKTYTRPLDKRTRRNKAQGVRVARGRKMQGRVRGAGGARGMEASMGRGPQARI